LIPAVVEKITCIADEAATTSPTVSVTVRLVGSVLTWLGDDPIVAPSSLSVTDPVLMEEGIVVPPGKVRVIVFPTLNPLVLPSENERSYCATTFTVVGFGVTFAAETVLEAEIV